MSWSMQATLPRLTYSTERGGCASSHARQARSGPYRRTKWRYCSAAVLAVVSLCSGPTAKVGLDSSASILPSSDASMASNVLTTTPDAESRIASATRAMKPHSASVSQPSTRIRSRTRSGSSSGTASSSRSPAGIIHKDSARTNRGKASMLRNVAALSVRSASAGTPSRAAAPSAAYHCPSTTAHATPGSSDARASRNGASQAALSARSCATMSA
ncbi:Os07g0241866, partial [Oryza sativa Japonica Group]